MVTVLRTAQPLQEGQDRPAALESLRKLAEPLGWIWRPPTCSLAIVDGVKFKPEGAAGPGSMGVKSVFRETVLARLLEPGHDARAYVIWSRDDGLKWKPGEGGVRSPVDGIRQLGWEQIRAYLKTGQLPPATVIDLDAMRRTAQDVIAKAKGKGEDRVTVDVRRAINYQLTGQKGVWAVTRTPTLFGYPCRCLELSPWGTNQCGQHYCACWGARHDVAMMPAWCCSRRFVIDWRRVAHDGQR